MPCIFALINNVVLVVFSFIQKFFFVIVNWNFRSSNKFVEIGWNENSGSFLAFVRSVIEEFSALTCHALLAWNIKQNKRLRALNTGNAVEERSSGIAVRHSRVNQHSRSQNIVGLYVSLFVLLCGNKVVQIVVVLTALRCRDALQSCKIELFFAADALKSIEIGRIYRTVLKCWPITVIYNFCPFFQYVCEVSRAGHPVIVFQDCQQVVSFGSEAFLEVWVEHLSSGTRFAGVIFDTPPSAASAVNAAGAIPERSLFGAGS